ncbi:BZ3500_MvSof-1268-A1-R1_Chr6-3g08950 [Microbotryum saponariae]|uniref:BZ3500_MvSof-1268-A1-R1_Chr6-3g08950 protein n=1 Tax=Microbotryum saponariae TaxID=289078 RepID=A0A2X0LD98_9BASI|nr:BZ3500_MvSof-1268-A1-R1_Chr6-3g08950 [Microbotryum saponariae]SDA07552.1 BZ3501_MvSof-1269-A2-R1_Chr6-2g08654 [Microbotryum saponariae]
MGRNLRHFQSTRHRTPRPPPLLPSDSLSVDSSSWKKRSLVTDHERWAGEQDGLTTFMLSPFTFDFYSPTASPTSPRTPRQHNSSAPSSPILAMTSTTRTQAHNAQTEKQLAAVPSAEHSEDYNRLLLTETSLRSLHVLGYTSLNTPRSSSTSTASSPAPSSRTASPNHFKTSSPKSGRCPSPSLNKIPADGMDPLDVFFGLSSAAEAKAFRSGLIGLGIEIGVKGGWEGVEDLEPLLTSTVKDVQEVQPQEVITPIYVAKKSKPDSKRAMRKSKSVKERLKHLFVASSSIPLYEQCD